MRILLLTSMCACFAGVAAAQDEKPVETPRTARVFQAGDAQPIADSAGPRDIERGAIIAEFRLATRPRMRFADATRTDALLDHLTIEGGGDVFCGPDGEPARRNEKPPPACFSDDDHDGAADHQHLILHAERDQISLGAITALPAPRPWSEAPADDRRIAFVYSGPVSGEVQPDGRLGAGVVEVAVISASDATPSEMRAPLAYPCLPDGRCLTIPVGESHLMLSNPMVEGGVHLSFVTADEAAAIETEVRAFVAQRQAEQDAANAELKPEEPGEGETDGGEAPEPTATPL